MARQPMLKFVDVERDMPVKRTVEDRQGDFHEIYHEFIKKKAEEQSSRCSQCGVPYCQTHCPLHNNIPDWLLMTATGRLKEAYELSQSTNTFPEICGRICPQDRLCEGNCVIEKSGHDKSSSTDSSTTPKSSRPPASTPKNTTSQKKSPNRKSSNTQKKSFPHSTPTSTSNSATG